MKNVPRYLVERWQTELEELFEESEQEDVLDWLIANHDRKRVVLLGAGFSRNAKNPRGVTIPLWQDLSKALAADLRIPADMLDPLSLADLHRRNLGDSAFQQRLLGLLDDEAIEPGAAHSALWNSNLEAVITTNFLDTLLDRNPRARPVIEDPDLARPVDSETEVQVIYLHGHRSQFASWVTGRSDYDDLPDERPMIFTRTRQLFAQFPLLIVGYSLNDPDFHFVYRQMVRAMNRRHPLGLAVLVPRKGDGVAQVERAAKKYWEELGLRIVRFRKPDKQSTEEQFVRFFSLTRRIEARKDLERSYRSCQKVVDIAGTFSANVDIMESAFGDRTLERVWSRSFDARARFWLAAEERALPKSCRDSAEEMARSFNLTRFRRPAAKDGAAPVGLEHEALEEPQLSDDVWLGEGDVLPGSWVESAWRLLNERRETSFVWKLQTLANACGRGNEVLARWLRAAIRPEILDEYSTDLVAVSCALLLLGGGHPHDWQLLGEFAAPRHPELKELLGAFGPPPKTKEPIVDVLAEAQKALRLGERERALERYGEAKKMVQTCIHPDRPLLTYFAFQGYADALAKDDFSEEARTRLTQAWEEAQQAREHPHVREWWARVDRFKSALFRARISQLEQDLSEAGYEASSRTWSDSGRRLYVLLQDARNLGAPLSVQVELTRPLLGTFAGFEELTVRIDLNIKNSGVWLSRALSNGDLFRPPSEGLIVDVAQAGTAERRTGVRELSKVLFRKGEDGTLSPTAMRGLRLRGTIQVLKEASEILLRDDVEVALRVIDAARREGACVDVIDALAAVSHVCCWQKVRGMLTEISEPRTLRDTVHRAQRFPWQHWVVCDGFLSAGEQGIDFIKKLAEGVRSPDRWLVGWVLLSILESAPDDDAVIDLCGRFSEPVVEALKGKEQVWDWEIEQIAGFAAVSGTFSARFPEIVEQLKEFMRAGKVVVRRILLQSWIESDLRAEAEESLRSGRGVKGIRDQVMVAVLNEPRRTVEWEPVREELGKSWKGLVELAPGLRPDIWSKEAWDDLRALLRVGGHRGKSASWMLARVKVAVDALDYEEPRRTLFDDSSSGLGFLRAALVEAVGVGDGLLANHAVYGLAKLARHTERDADADAIACALRAAADDVRIDVVHGAGFVACYLREYGKQRSLHPVILEAVNDVAAALADDPLAIVERQCEFGTKKARLDIAGAVRSG